LEGLASRQPEPMHKYKKNPVIKARVESRIMREIEANEARPPRLVNELLACEEVERFCYPETRGPQEPVLAPNLFDPLPLVEMPAESTSAVIPLLAALMVFIAGVAVGMLL